MMHTHISMVGIRKKTKDELTTNLCTHKYSVRRKKIHFCRIHKSITVESIANEKKKRNSCLFPSQK